MEQDAHRDILAHLHEGLGTLGGPGLLADARLVVGMQPTGLDLHEGDIGGHHLGETCRMDGGIGIMGDKELLAVGIDQRIGPGLQLGRIGNGDGGFLCLCRRRDLGVCSLPQRKEAQKSQSQDIHGALALLRETASMACGLPLGP